MVKSVDIGILFIHGIVGNNRIFNFLTPYIPEGCDVSWLTLCGHGGDALAFSRASMERWKAQVSEAVGQMRDRCRKVIVVAHSMGCLFAIAEALKGMTDALLLLNPPMKIRLTKRMFTNAAKVAVGRTHHDPIAQSALAAYGIALDRNPLHYYGWPARYLELFAEIRNVRRLLSCVTLRCATRVFLSAKDEMVSVRSASYFSNQPDCRLSVLNDASHYYFTASAQAEIGREFSTMLSAAQEPLPD